MKLRSILNILDLPCWGVWVPGVAMAVACSMVSGCGQDRLALKSAVDPHSQSSTHSNLRLHQVESHVLQNLIQITDRIYSGGEPRGEEAFQELNQLGIQTIMSVDGARPDLVRAKQYGLRYVHIPIGYDGVDSHEALSIVRTMRETTGKIYVHCHHGRHRGPVAAAIACMAGGKIGPDEGLTILEVAGTSRDYVGLWRDVEAFRVPDADVVLPDLVEVAIVEDLAETMAKMDRVFDQLEHLQSNHWITPATHADLDAEQEALILREFLHESGRLMDGEGKEALRESLEQAESEVVSLQKALAASDSEKASTVLKQIKTSCKACHHQHRNF